MSELSIEKPDDYDETLERRWLERTEDSKENDPRWRRVLDEQASEEEGTPVTKWVRVDREDERPIEGLHTQKIKNGQHDDVKRQGEPEGGEGRDGPVQPEGEPFAQEVLRGGKDGTQQSRKKGHRRYS